jgi:hypothetical protein
MCTLTIGVYLHNEMSPVAMVTCPRDTRQVSVQAGFCLGVRY